MFTDPLGFCGGGNGWGNLFGGLGSGVTFGTVQPGDCINADSWQFAAGYWISAPVSAVVVGAGSVAAGSLAVEAIGARIAARAAAGAAASVAAGTAGGSGSPVLMRGVGDAEASLITTAEGAIASSTSPIPGHTRVFDANILPNMLRYFQIANESRPGLYTHIVRFELRSLPELVQESPWATYYVSAQELNRLLMPPPKVIPIEELLK
jgi:hypothetical protein